MFKDCAEASIKVQFHKKIPRIQFLGSGVSIDMYLKVLGNIFPEKSYGKLVFGSDLYFYNKETMCLISYYCDLGKTRICKIVYDFPESSPEEMIQVFSSKQPSGRLLIRILDIESYTKSSCKNVICFYE